MPARLTEIKADMKKDKAKFRTVQSNWLLSAHQVRSAKPTWSPGKV